MAKTNEKRKQANRLLRVIRGNRKAGNPLPGHSRIYNEQGLPEGYVLSDAYKAHGAAIREQVAEVTKAQWGTNEIRPHISKSTNRWF